MRRIMRILLLSCTIWTIIPLMVLSLCSPSVHDFLARSEKKLFAPKAFATSLTDFKRINHKIKTIKAILLKEKNQRKLFLKKIKIAKFMSEHIRFQLQKTEAALKKESKILKKLHYDQTVYQAKVTTQRYKLAMRLRSAYMIGQELYLKLLLNQNDVQCVTHLLMYYRGLSKNQLSAIQNLQTTLTHLQQNHTLIQSKMKTLQNLKKRKSNEQIRLKALKSDRKQVITKLNNKINTKNHRIIELLTNKQLLEQTFDRLEKRHQIQTFIKQNLSDLKGKLDWPTKGVILPCFGMPIKQSELKRDGILIRAPENQPVYAVAAGTVVFAKWLPGYGLLLIINHGHGYMTLYGRNHNLYKRSGDTVRQGELITTVGQSGGHEKPALYFAIRHNAKPLNPAIWCREGGNS